MEFPKKLQLPKNVYEERAQRESDLIGSASLGVFLRTCIIIFELFGVWLYGSAALLMDALASAVDVVSSVLLIIFIKVASRPPDQNHPFGHGRYEPLVGLQLGLLLLIIGGAMIVQQFYHGIDHPIGEAISNRAWIIPVVAVILLEICYRVVMRAAKKQKSPALVVDAFHYRIDALTSLFAAFALIFAAFVPKWSHQIDHMGAILIAILMIVLGAIAARKNVNQLLDHVPERSFFWLVEKAAMKAEGVLGTEKVRIQMYGPDAHVDIDVEVDPMLSVEVAHKISQQVRLEIQKAWPMVRDVTVHIEPYYPNDH